MLAPSLLFLYLLAILQANTIHEHCGHNLAAGLHSACSSPASTHASSSACLQVCLDCDPDAPSYAIPACRVLGQYGLQTTASKLSSPAVQAVVAKLRGEGSSKEQGGAGGMHKHAYRGVEANLVESTCTVCSCWAPPPAPRSFPPMRHASAFQPLPQQTTWQQAPSSRSARACALQLRRSSGSPRDSLRCVAAMPPPPLLQSPAPGRQLCS